MSNPSEIMRRLNRQRRSPIPRQAVAPRPPAPAPAAGLSPVSPILPARDAPQGGQGASPAPEQAVPAAAQRPAPARPTGGHALYSEVMRSHDRMGTRHLDRKG